jgi:hypothetical protein
MQFQPRRMRRTVCCFLQLTWYMLQQWVGDHHFVSAMLELDSCKRGVVMLSCNSQCSTLQQWVWLQQLVGLAYSCKHMQGWEVFAVTVLGDLMGCAAKTGWFEAVHVCLCYNDVFLQPNFPVLACCCSD